MKKSTEFWEASSIYRGWDVRKISWMIRIQIEDVFVLVSNLFQKCFSINVGVWLRMENKFSGNYFQLTVCFNGFDSKIGFSQNFHFKPFPDSCAKREREREREREERAQSSDRAPVWRPQQRTPQTELNDHRPSSSLTYQIALVSSMAAPRQSSKDRLQRRTILPLDQT